MRPPGFSAGRDSHEAFLAKVLDHCNCEVCDRHLTRADVVSVRRSESMWLISVVCSSCQARGLIFVLIKDGSALLGSPEPEAPEPRDAGREGVSLDDCQQFHEFLRTFDGGFTELFREGD